MIRDRFESVKDRNAIPAQFFQMLFCLHRNLNPRSFGIRSVVLAPHQSLQPLVVKETPLYKGLEFLMERDAVLLQGLFHVQAFLWIRCISQRVNYSRLVMVG